MRATESLLNDVALNYIARAYEHVAAFTQMRLVKISCVQTSKKRKKRNATQVKDIYDLTACKQQSRSKRKTVSIKAHAHGMSASRKQAAAIIIKPNRDSF